MGEKINILSLVTKGTGAPDYSVISAGTFQSIGSLPTVRSAFTYGSYTIVDKNNPAIANGYITTVQIYSVIQMTSVAVGIFSAAGDNLTTRDYVTIGVVPEGLQKFSVNLQVNTGDYIGIYFAGGRLYRDVSIGAGYWYISGNYISCIGQAFTSASPRAISLYGTGTRT